MTLFDMLSGAGVPERDIVRALTVAANATPERRARDYLVSGNGQAAVVFDVEPGPAKLARLRADGFTVERIVDILNRLETT